MFSNVTIILNQPSHPGNIGAVARAMKTMGLCHLTLVAPKEFPHEEATIRASHASDILEQVTVVGSLDEALKECHWVFGTTSREPNRPIPTLEPREAANKTRAEIQAGAHVGFLFGTESTGLTSNELDACHTRVIIPTNPEYASLNLAHAVQIICYELWLALRTFKRLVVEEVSWADRQEMGAWYLHLEQVLTKIGFLIPKQPKKLMQRLKRLFNRHKLDKTELNILRGILQAVEQKISDPNKGVKNEQ